MYIRFQVTADCSSGTFISSPAAVTCFDTIAVSTNASMSAGVANDSLKKFIKRIGVQEGSDDDTDTEDTTVEDSQSSPEFLDVTHSLYALCAPSLLTALRIPSVTSAEHSSDRLVLVLKKCSELSSTVVLYALNEFVRVLSCMVNASHTEHALIQRYLAIMCGKKHTQMLMELVAVLLSHIPSVSEGTTTVLHFLLLLLSGNAQGASELIQKQILELHSRTYEVLSADKQDNQDGSHIDSTMLDLQYILKLLETNFTFTISKATTTDHHVDRESEAGTCARLRGQLSVFAHQYSALLPLISCAIRNAALYTALCVHGRYDIVQDVLTHPVTLTDLSLVYNALATPLQCDAADAEQQPAQLSGKIDSLIVPGDAGYAYLSDITREETIKTLYGRPEGSFLVRPHETLPEQFYLSFRTGHSGVHSGSRDSAIKHAVVRRSRVHTDAVTHVHTTVQTTVQTTTVHAATAKSHTAHVTVHAPLQSATSSHTTSHGVVHATDATTVGPLVTPGLHKGSFVHSPALTPSSSSLSLMDEQINHSGSPLPAALQHQSPFVVWDGDAAPIREIRVTDSGVEAMAYSTAVSRDSYTYQCGKLGPCGSLDEMLRQISSVLENPLIFALIFPPHASLSAARLAGAAPAHTAAGAPVLLDLNQYLWLSLSALCSTVSADSTSTTATPSDSTVPPVTPAGGGGRPLSTSTGAASVHGGSAVVPVKPFEEQDPWRIVASPSKMALMFHQVVEVLVMTEYVKQLCLIVDMCNALSVRNCESAADEAHSAQVRHFYVSFQLALSTWPTVHSGANISAPTFTASSIGSVPSGAFTKMVSRFRTHMEGAEQALHCALLPPLSLHAWYIPPLEHNIRPSATPPQLTDAPAGPLLAFTPEDELLVAEYLLAMLGQTTGSKSVKLTSPSGAEHVTLFHCIVAEDLHKTVQQWRELYIQHESALTQRLAAKRVAERLRINAADKTAAANVNVTTTVPAAASNLTADASPNPSASLESAVPTVAPTSPLVLDTSESAPAAFDYDTSTVGRNTHNTATTLSLTTYTVLKRVSESLKIDLTCATKEYLRRIIAWISDELQLVYEVTRPGEYAFSAAQRFYCPHHPWEVKVLRDFSQVAERVRLGRYSFSSGSNTTATPSVPPVVAATSVHSEYFNSTVAPCVNNLEKQKLAQFGHLWDHLGAEKYLQSTLGTAILPKLRDDLPVQYDITTRKEAESTYSPYLGAIERQMYRNCLYNRLNFSVRSVPLVQVDIYGVQEVLAVRPSSTMHSSAPVAIPSGVSPMTYMSMFNKPTVLTPTSNIHTASSLDLYAIVHLSHTHSAHQSGTTAMPMAATSGGSGTSTPAGRKHVTPLTTKNCPNGTLVTSVHKAEARRTPLESSETPGSVGGNSGSGVSTNGAGITSSWLKQQQQSITRAVEYNWRDQALFRYPLPEGLTCAHRPPHCNGPVLHAYEHHSDSAVVNNNSPLSPFSGMKGPYNDTSSAPAVVVPVPAQYCEVPSVLVLAVYERTFFSDTLLGELELDLSTLTDKKMLRGWYPLTIDRNISWLVYLQVRLKFQEMCVESAASQVMGAQSGYTSESSTPKVTANISAKIIKQMDDF